MLHQQKRDSPRGYLSFVFVLSHRDTHRELTGLSRRLHNQAKPSLNARIPGEAVGELVLRLQVQEYCPTGKILDDIHQPAFIG